MIPLFPFTALVGQDEMKRALLLNAVDPAIGGVLIRGERGTAKSTAARGLAGLLPAQVENQPAPFVELPLGATEDRIVGSLDLQPALREGVQRLRSGLLAKAHGGVLYVDEVNLLPDHLVDLLLDAAAGGKVTIERDGLSATENAQFILLGSMNPEEGELRPQFLDRFGLCVEVKAPSETVLRVETIRRRLDYERDPVAFMQSFEPARIALGERISAARARLVSIPLNETVLAQAAALCAHLKLEGVRGDLTLIKTARALAAWESSPTITSEHLREAATYALPHRRRKKPFDPIDQSAPEIQAFFDPPESSPEEGAPASAQRPAPAARSSGAVHLATKVGATPSSGRRAAENQAAGGVVRAIPLREGQALAVAPTLLAAAARGAAVSGPELLIDHSDLRQLERAGRGAARVLFVVDASGSMAAQRRLSLAKGAVTGLITGSYQRRDEVAVIVFRGETAELLLPFTRDVARAEAALREVPTGGRTPLATALKEAHQQLRGHVPTLLVLFTDGRANVSAQGGDAWQEALTLARELALVIAGALVVDCETGPVTFDRARELADLLGAECVKLEALDASNLTLRLQKKLSA